MTGKRALIVDDSKSARAFLAKILERHELVVDSAESAEHAIDYLADNLPDVIFMDHQMPGMDGFQAVQAIKNNPRTAMIPIMMYTSQEGELYLGQARALGAVGVLPKQIKTADVSKVLYQLHLAAERRTGDQTSFRPYVGDAEPTGEHTILPGPPAAHTLTDLALREQLAELRRAVMTGLDSQSERVAADVRSMFLEGMPSSRGSGVMPWLVALLSLTTAIATGVLWHQESQRSAQLSKELAEVRDIQARESSSTAGGVPAAAVGATPAEGAVAPASEPIVAQIPYGEEAFGGARLELIRQLFRRLASQNFRGTVEIVTFPGRFCLVGSAAEGFSLAPDEMPVGRCDLVGNPYDDGQQSPQRQPLALANLIGDFRHVTKRAADVKVNSGEPGMVVNTYPPATPATTAGDWNRAAAANNRLEIRLH